MFGSRYPCLVSYVDSYATYDVAIIRSGKLNEQVGAKRCNFYSPCHNYLLDNVLNNMS